jgi:hypothetical protein
MNEVAPQILSGLHRGEIDQLRLTAAEWKILRRYLEHNLNNGMSGLVLIQYHLQHGTSAPEDVRLLQVALDRVQQVVATIAALEEEAALAEEGR